ncbi:MAG: hypothetical protein J6X58_07010 [Bacteroidales bacterium]|nr:hypothetical protein [Bacteroidales bacterium]
MQKAVYNYELFRLKPEDVEKLKKSETADDICLLGRWYWITAPVEDYQKQAEACFRKAMELGSKEAQLNLANMYRLGAFGMVDMDEYCDLRDTLYAEGYELAEIRWCRDRAYGIGNYEDIDKALEDCERLMAKYKKPDPRWYDLLGNIYLEKGDTKKSNEYFLKAIEGGYLDAYSGLVDMPEMLEKGRAAGCGGCCVLLAEEIRKRRDYMEGSDADIVEAGLSDSEKQAALAANAKGREELKQQEIALYEEAVKLGEPTGYYCLGMMYYDEDDEKAWNYFMRGCSLGHPYCMSMIAEMINEGMASDQYHWEDVCLYRLYALRYGDDDQLLPVVHAYNEGELKEFAEEIENIYIPKFESQEYDVDGLEDWPDDDDYEDDDGRYDAYV